MSKINLPEWWVQNRHDLAVLDAERRGLAARVAKGRERLARLERMFEAVVARDETSAEELAALDAVEFLAKIIDPEEPWRSYTDCLGNAEAFADAVGEPIPELDDAIRAIEAFLEPPPPEIPEDDFDREDAEWQACDPDDMYYPPEIGIIGGSTDLRFLADHILCLRDLDSPSWVKDAPERLLVAKARRRWVKRHIRPPKPAARPKPAAWPEFDENGDIPF